MSEKLVLKFENFRGAAERFSIQWEHEPRCAPLKTINFTKGDVSMTSESKTKLHHINTASIQAHDHRVLTAALKVGFFIWHYFEMMLAMGAGATLFELLVRELPVSTRYGLGLQPSTFPYTIGIALSMMFVMVAWMIVRGHGWRHSAEMAIAMLVPVALMALISILKENASPVWFVATYCSAMCVGMLGAMLFRWNHFTHWSFRSSHKAH
jgi:uncharacterized membrane protein